MKYIPAEKLIAEIEQYKQGAAIARFDNAGENADYFQGKVDLCNDLTHIITSLQQEQLPTEREIAEAHHYAEIIREKDKAKIQQEQPKFNVGDLVVSKKNSHLTYKILATNLPNELGKTDYKVEIFTDGKPDEPHNIHLISSDKIEDWGELVQQEQPEVDLGKEEFVGVAESPLKTFPRVNDFECGGSYRH